MAVSKPILYVLAAIGFVYVVVTLYVWSGLARTCTGNDVRTAVSPSLERTARIRVESCNDRDRPMVVLDLSDRSNPDRSSSVELGIATSTDLDLTWKSDHELSVALPSTFKLSQEPGAVGDVQLQLVFKNDR